MERARPEHWGIGKNLMIQGHHQQAMPWLEKSFAYYEDSGARLSMAMVWSEMAICHLGMGADARALELLQNALQIEGEAGTIHNYQVTLADIGSVYLYRGDHLTAIDHYRRALELARQIQDPVSVYKCSYNIRLAYARMRESIDRMEPGTV